VTIGVEIFKTDAFQQSVHSASFAFRGPDRPLPRTPKFNFETGNLDSSDEFDDDDGDTDGEPEHVPLRQNYQGPMS
jgi:hypothetical protein